MKIAYLKEFWDRYQTKMSISISLKTNPSLLFTGDSGTGKSYAVKWLIRNLLKEEKVDFWFCNGKDSLDFEFLKGYEKYFCARDCEKGFNLFYDRFCEIQEKEGEKIDHFTILIFDEYVSFLLRTQNENKKKADEYMRKMTEMLCFFRSYKGGCWIVTQRPDAKYLGDGRNNTHTQILLTRGRPSREALGMLNLTKDDLKADSYGVGEGVCYIDGKGLFEIKYPKYDASKIEAEILSYLEHAGRA